MVDKNNRWVYQGSVTTPPCAQKVYWNVLRTVYPIKQKHVDLFKAQLTRGEEGRLVDFGNWRVIQPVTTQNVGVVTDGFFGEKQVPTSNIDNINFIVPEDVGFEAEMTGANIKPRSKSI